MNRLTFLDFKTALDSIDAVRSVHHNVAKLKAAREMARVSIGLRAAEPSNVASLAEARARRLDRRRHGLSGRR